MNIHLYNSAQGKHSQSRLNNVNSFASEEKNSYSYIHRDRVSRSIDRVNPDSSRFDFSKAARHVSAVKERNNQLKMHESVPQSSPPRAIPKPYSGSKFHSPQTTKSRLTRVPSANNLSCVSHNHSCVSNYFEKRSQQTADKLHKLKVAKRRKEEGEMRDKPAISEYSRYLGSKSRMNVFDRLTSPNHKRAREIENIKENNFNNTFKPEISRKSGSVQRTVNDLYEWKRKIERKKENLSREISNNQFTPKLSRKTEQILQDKRPNYINLPVAERLQKQAEM